MTRADVSIRLNGREVESRAGRVAITGLFVVLTPVILVVSTVVLVVALGLLAVLLPVLAAADVTLRAMGRRGFVVRDGGSVRMRVDRAAFRRLTA
jgi:hypothetical protein